MGQAKQGDVIRVHYTGRLEDGTQFDSSMDSDPIEFTVGNGDLIAGFENGVVGMEVGEKKTITIPPDQAYGDRQDTLIAEINKSDFPSEITPEIGLPLQVQHPDGNQINVIIIEMTENTVTIDANPPLAGETLIFDLELVEIISACP